MNYRLGWFMDAMLDKLDQNDHKTHWSNATQSYLLGRLADEVGELRRAVLVETPDPDRVLAEAADVANFAMMIADNADQSRRTL